MTEFFQISSFVIGSKKPYNATTELAWNTYKDPDPSESVTRDAVWLHENHFTGWMLTYSLRDSDTTIHQVYYDRIEESLNLAIQYCAAAINYASDFEIPEDLEEDSEPFPLNILLSVGGVILAVVLAGLFIKSKT